MAGRRPIPTKLKLLRGNPGHRRLNPDEPKPRELSKAPPAPVFLGEIAKAEWRRRAREFVDLGMLTSADLGVLAGYCEAFGRFAEASEEFRRLGRPYTITTDKGFTVKHPLLGIIDAAEKTMRSFATEFGMTPAARPKVSISPKRSEEDLNFSDGRLRLNPKSDANRARS
jgi:P27 family predicted phage terminase small subunit